MNIYLLGTLLLSITIAIIPATRAATTATPPATNPTANTVPSVTARTGDGGGGTKGGAGGPAGAPQLPVWAQCLSQAPKDAPTDSSVVSLFRHWCSNYETVIPCVTTGLPTAASQNPLDMFVKLHFDSNTLRTRSESLCRTFTGLGDKLNCVQQSNATLEAWCRARFSQGLQYVFAVQLQKAFDTEPNIYKELACQVTEDTSGCQGAAMTTCDNEVKGHLLAYYSLLTNETCIADPADPYTTPAPPPTPKAPAPDVVVTCAQRVAQTVPPSEPLAENATPLSQLKYGLRQNCRSFEARYNCYNEELDRITNPSFRDIWLSFTFDSANAIQSQKEFCQAFEGGVVGQVTEDCYNKTQSSLQRCEGLYGNAVVSLQRQYVDGQLDDIALHKSACRASMQRAFCLRDAFKQCSVALGEAMLASELGTLPNICFTLPAPGSNSTSTTTNSINRNPVEPVPNAETTGDDVNYLKHDRNDWQDNNYPVAEGTPEQDQKSPNGVSAGDSTGNVGQSTGGNGGSASGLAASVITSLAAFVLVYVTL